MTIEALDLLRERMARHAIECEWQPGFLGVATSARKGAELTRWADRIEGVYNYPLVRIPPAEMGGWIASRRYHSGIHDPRSGHLHPLKYALGIARAAHAAGVRIFEHTPVTALHHGPVVRLETAGGEVIANQVLLAGNVYLQDVVPALERRIMPVGTYIVCTDPLEPSVANSLVPSRSAVCDTDFVLDYFRTTSDDRLLYGGRVSYSTRTPRHLDESMHRRMVHTFPHLASAKIEFSWGGFVDITMNRAPDFGRIGQNVYYLQGFSGHGLALTGLAGRLVAEAITGDASRFDVFARLQHNNFPGGRLMRMPALVLGMAWYRLKDLL
jgi:gamma-glutamylputrescine oxidase